MNRNVVIGIEGLVGAGKTSICREMLKVVPNSVLLNGGNLYRAIVFALTQKEKNIFRLQKLMKNADIKKYMDDLKIELKIEHNETAIYIDGEKADEEKLQSNTSSLYVSIIGGIADNTKLFEFARDYINELKSEYNIIVSGRALMKIYPQIDYHIFITADIEQRVNRKCIQYSKDIEENIVSKNEVKKSIIRRDKLQKIAGFYKVYPNTIKIDTTDCKSISESTQKVLKTIKLSCMEEKKSYGVCK